jgi:hypothetical protein
MTLCGHQPAEGETAKTHNSSPSTPPSLYPDAGSLGLRRAAAYYHVQIPQGLRILNPEHRPCSSQELGEIAHCMYNAKCARWRLLTPSALGSEVCGVGSEEWELAWDLKEPAACSKSTLHSPIHVTKYVRLASGAPWPSVFVTKHGIRTTYYYGLHTRPTTPALSVPYHLSLGWRIAL